MPEDALERAKMRSKELSRVSGRDSFDGMPASGFQDWSGGDPVVAVAVVAVAVAVFSC